MSEAQLKSADTLLEVANFLVQAGNFDKAVEKFQQALESEPENPATYNAIGLTLLELNKCDVALDLFRKAISLRPDSSESYRNLGLAFYALEDRTSSAAALEQAVELDPSNGDALLNLGQLHKETGRPRIAKHFLERAIVSKRTDPVPFCERAEISLAEENYAEAAQFALASWNLKAGNARALKTLTAAYRHLGKHDDAVRCGQALIELEPQSSEAHVEFTKALLDGGETERALATATVATTLDEGYAPAHAHLGLAHARLGALDAGLASIDRALEIEADNENFLAMKAEVLMLRGAQREAFDLVAPLVRDAAEVKSDSLQVYLSLAGRYGEAENALRIIESALRSKGLPHPVRRGLNFTAGDLYSSLDRHEEAFEAYRTGNDMRGQRFKYDRHAAYVQRAIDTYTTDYFRSVARPSESSGRPIFIVGMPRSGTSLTETILSCHSEVYACGELKDVSRIVRGIAGLIGGEAGYPQCMAQAGQAHLDQAVADYLASVDGQGARGAPRFTDKLPSNFANIGFIHTLFPDAVIVHCQRDPLDTCLSCFFQDFSDPAANFADRLEDLGAYFLLYRRMMDHWREVLPTAIYELRYEDLVQDPQPQIARLLEHCGLQWQDACLSPHESSYTIRTASHEQVREPIYTRSIGRWKQYESQLQPLIDMLASEGCVGSSTG